MKTYTPSFIALDISIPNTFPPIKLITDKIEMKNSGAAMRIAV